MKVLRKEMVKGPDGKYVEAYVDKGPKGAKIGHDLGLRRGAFGAMSNSPTGTNSNARHLA